MAKLAGAKLRALRKSSGFQLSSTSISILSYKPTEIKAFLSWQAEFSMGRSVKVFKKMFGNLSGRNILFGGKNFSVRTMPREVCVTTHYTVKKFVEIPVYIYVDAADQTT
jgi:hypothetical protein